MLLIEGQKGWSNIDRCISKQWEKTSGINEQVCSKFCCAYAAKDNVVGFKSFQVDSTRQ